MKKAYFLSDIHLGASYHENERELERGVVAFLDSIREEAAEIYLLGDILDYWFEYRHVVPRGYVRFFGKLAELADSGIKITWLIGNHDIWIFDYLPGELGIRVADGVDDVRVLGSTPFSIQHGDALSGDLKFRILRSLFRNRICQKLYSGIHPRWTVGFAYGCSRRSRLGKKKCGRQSSSQKNGMENVREKRPEGMMERIRRWCVSQIAEGNPAEYYLFGHLHSLHDEPLPSGRRLIVVPDWPTSKLYGVFDGKNFTFEKFE